MSENKSIIPYLIIVVFVLFGIFIGQFVYRSTQNSTDLVSEEYYQEEIAFEQKITYQKNFLSIQDAVSINYKDNNLLVHFPKNWNTIKGTVKLYNVADKNQDLSLPFSTISDSLKLKFKDLKTGNWTLKLQFEHENKSYYHEQKLDI